MNKKQNINTTKSKPELLMPAGSIEAYYAAIAGGADAVYLGLSNFNARKRANNFTPWQVAAIVNDARQNGVKIYITLNTVIRNNELSELIDTLFVLSQIKPQAIIIQDWGVYYLAKKYFPELKLHASTQMGNHNSTGLSHAAKMGFKRVVMARELTQAEIEKIAHNRKTEIELFVHGALCYSFSGMCLFSSYLGGASANRGMCAQPCRRIYSSNNTKNYFFSLKDNQLIDHLPFLEKIKIDSLKVEGRLKSAEYVYQVATQYRKAIDNLSKIEEARKALNFDFGREKTDYFFGKDVGDAITQSANTGLLIGKVISKIENTIKFTSTSVLDNNCKLRFRNKNNDRQTDLKIDHLQLIDQIYQFQHKAKDIETDDEVYLTGLGFKFDSKIKTEGIKINIKYPEQKARNIKSALGSKNPPKQGTKTYIRIDQLNILQKLNPADFEGIILNISHTDLETLNLELPFFQQNKRKTWIELPKFIAEAKIDFYQSQLKRIAKAGINNFSLSQLSQKELLPDGARFMTNENVYVFNDAAARLTKEEGAFNFIYPFENDIVNLSKAVNRNGIVPVYFTPALFYSRMPVKVEKETFFKDANGKAFFKIVRDGITMVLPEQAVSITQFKQKLERYGYSNYLIDMSFDLQNKNTPSAIRKKLMNSEAVITGNIFNFKRELK
ncbi:MAG TPA: peptidase U32 family protein [Prolixibacteraceae bacterium]|nr:peptidase U32 family protein [Prolixibacteraceae bacterium]